MFTQPPMPIKCAGAPQKAMYLSADHWRRQAVLDDIDIDFYNAGGVLFGVQDYVPALMEYVERYDIELNFQHNADAHRRPGAREPGSRARCRTARDDGRDATFDMIHVVPPQTAPDFIRVSRWRMPPGWVDVDQATLRHKTLSERSIALGDA